jgi:hypothetical protein
MTAVIECNFCDRRVDPDDDEFSSEEYNRMGLDVADEPYVILESRFPGRDRYDHPKHRRVIGHFHYPDCYNAALRLLRDRQRWARERDRGPDAAALPQWKREKLQESVKGASTAGTQPDREPRVPAMEAMVAWEEKMAVADGPGGIHELLLDQVTWRTLVRADLVLVADVEAREGEGTLGLAYGIGSKRLIEIREALVKRGASRSDT